MTVSTRRYHRHTQGFVMTLSSAIATATLCCSITLAANAATFTGYVEVNPATEKMCATVLGCSPWISPKWAPHNPGTTYYLYFTSVRNISQAQCNELVQTSASYYGLPGDCTP